MSDGLALFWGALALAVVIDLGLIVAARRSRRPRDLNLPSPPWPP